MATALTVIGAVALGGCGGKSRHPANSQQPTANSKAPLTQTVKVISHGGTTFDAQRIYRSRSPGVVTIVSLSAPAPGTARQSGSLGSGFVVDSSGDIATNAHVVTSDSGKPAKAVYVEFADGNRLTGRIVGTDPNADVALLKIDPSALRGPNARLVPVPLGSTSKLTVGDPVAAIGSPFGEEQSLSVGVVSAKGRDIESLTRFAIGNAIQTDAAINHGNSGGPLLDSDGRVVGMNSQIRSTGGGGEGVGFAIPVETVKHSLGQLRASGHVTYAYLGISSLQLYPQLAERLKLPVTSGALVDVVQDGSPAKRAGLRGCSSSITFQGVPHVPVGADVILAVNGKKIAGADDLSDVIGRLRPGGRVSISILRDGHRRTVPVTLAARPGRPGQ